MLARTILPVDPRLPSPVRDGECEHAPYDPSGATSLAARRVGCQSPRVVILEGPAVGLSIKNDEVEAMIREVAAARGVSMTEAVRLALAHEVERVRAERAAEVERRKRTIMEGLERIWALPVLDDRSPDEILGYDENGLPT